MTSTGPAAAQAELFLEMGPAARLMAQRAPDENTLHALKADLVDALRPFERDGRVSLTATVQMVSALAPYSAATP